MRRMVGHKDIFKLHLMKMFPFLVFHLFLLFPQRSQLQHNLEIKEEEKPLVVSSSSPLLTLFIDNTILLILFVAIMSASSIQVWGEGLIQGFANRPSSFTINPNGLRMEGITFAIEGPSRPDFIFNHPPGGLVEVYYTPTFPGSYRIHIKFFGRDVPGSPFAVEVVGDLESKVNMARDVIQNVKISGPAATNGKSLITNQFLLDARNAVVSGGLNASVEGPGNVQVGFKENLDGTIHVQYKPSHSGVYKLNLRFGDIPVVGSPFIINVN